MWGNSLLKKMLCQNGIKFVLSSCISMSVMITLTVYADVTLAPIHTDAPQTLEELRLSDSSEVAKLPRFDSRDYQIITPVKDQGSSDLCWAYASVSCSEASILRKGIDHGATNNTLSLSAENLGYARHNRGSDPLGNTKGEITGANWYNTSGEPGYGATVWSQWCGPVKTGVTVDLKTIYNNTDYRLENAICIENEKDRDAIKRAIVQYGAVTFSYNNKSERDYHNAKNETGSSAYPHACTIIGWDDSIPAEKFQPGGATQDGGWIIKNSYHSLPYFYLSYDCGSSTIIAFDYATREEYEYNYFYDSQVQDFGLTLSLKCNNAANVFEAKKGTDSMSEYIKAVNVGIIGKNVTCKAEIYTDLQKEQDISNISNITPTKGTLVAQKTATFEHSGYYTIVLDKPIKIEKGSYFSVVVKVSNGAGNAVVRLTQESNLTYQNKDYWYKSKYAARIKAFTVCEENGGVCEPEEHIWDSGVVTEPAGCESMGNMLYTCTICGQTKNEAIAAAGHQWDKWEITVNPTQTKTGAAVRGCLNDTTHKENHTLPVLSDTTVWAAGDFGAPTENRDGWQEYTSEYGTVTVVLPCLPPTVFSARYTDDGKVMVTAPRPGTYYMLFAAYKNGRTCNVTTVHVTFQEAGKQIIVPPAGFGNDTIGAVRIFFWNVFSDMLPLCPAI